MKIRGGYILYLLILCAVVGCKGTSSPSTASETDKYAGTCEGEKAKAILWVDYKRGRKIADGTPIRTGSNAVDSNNWHRQNRKYHGRQCI